MAGRYLMAAIPDDYEDDFKDQTRAKREDEMRPSVISQIKPGRQGFLFHGNKPKDPN